MQQRTADAPPDRPRVAYFWGEDAFAIERSVAQLARDLGDLSGPLDAWVASADEDDASPPDAGAVSATSGRRRGRLLDEIEARLATAPLFGVGMLVVVRQPAGLGRDASTIERLTELPTVVAPGNGLCFADLVPPGAKGPAAGGAVRDAVARAGGMVREHPVPTRERMEAWVTGRASELGMTLRPGAARLVAERTGGYVREADVDRRRQTELANAELEKLALYRPGEAISREDVAELVSEAVPGSTWAFLDAVAARRSADAARLAERLQREGLPLQVLVSQLHRRLRELVVVREHLATGAKPPDLVRVLKVQPYRAQKLAEQALAWGAGELEGALGGLLELDLVSKGISLDGRMLSISEERSRLALGVWLAEHLDRAGARSA